LIFIIVGVIIVAAVLCIGSTQLSKLGQANAALTPTEEVTVEMAVRARGEVVPATWAELSFDSSGTLAEWYVSEGEIVEAGALLGRLETTQLELTLAQAEADLEAAQVRLEQAEEEHAFQVREAELAQEQAEARLSQSQARYPSITAAEVELERADKALLDAQEAYRRAAETPGRFETPGVRDHYQEQIDKAEQDVAVAQAALRSARGEQAATSRELDVLEGDVTRADLSLEQLAQGVDPTLVQEVKRAELQVAQAEANLEAATLVAPFAGTVTELLFKAEDWVQPGAPALVLADMESLQVQTTDLDEWAVTQIEVGDPVEVALTAFDERTLSGHVSEIALRGETLPGGDVAYPTTISLEEIDAGLRWGMTVRISIPLEE
jgi:multidrug resistance efflux pump